MTDLKPCPFCGTNAGMSGMEGMDDRRYFRRVVECYGCECRLEATINWSEYRTLSASAASDRLGDLAAQAWNKRTEPDALDEIDRLRKALTVCSRVLHSDLRNMIEWGDGNPAVKDAADAARAALAEPEPKG